MYGIITDMEGVVRDSKNAFHHAYEYSLASVCKLKLDTNPEKTWKLRGFREFNSQRTFLKVIYAIAKSNEGFSKIFWKKYPIDYIKKLVKENPISKDALDMMEGRYLEYLIAPHILRRIPPIRAGKRGVRILKEQGFKVGALTNSSDIYNNRWIKRRKMENYFDGVFGVEEAGVQKPEPDGLIKACEKIKTKLDKTFYVGDTEVDVITAKKAGCIPIAVLSGATERKTLRDLGATHIFKSLTEFAFWIRDNKTDFK